MQYSIKYSYYVVYYILMHNFKMFKIFFNENNFSTISEMCIRKNSIDRAPVILDPLE